MSRGRLIVAITLMALSARGACPDASRGIGVLARDPAAELRVGKQHLVVIAINKYREWMPLSSPVPDAQELKEILVSRYHIDRVYELYDEQATKANIIKLFVTLQDEVEVDDSLLVLYAGHGHLERSSSTGFWIPVNAGTDLYEQHNWLPHTQLRGLIANIKALHIFVISDSCFAGDLIFTTRSLPRAIDDEYYRSAYSRVSRQVLTSGAIETVPDDSVFANQLKWTLKRNDRRFLDTLTLYNELRLGVKSSVPLLGSLAGTGHQEGASFLLFLREEAAAADESGAGSPLREEPLSAARTLPAAVLEAAPALPRRRFSAGIGLGWLFPLARATEPLRGAAPSASSRLDYSLRTRTGELSVGLMAAVMAANYDDPGGFYELRSYPLAVYVRASTLSASPFYLATEVAVGAAINVVTFDEEDLPPLTITRFFLAPALGIGVRLLDRLRVTAGGRFVVIVFDRSVLTGIVPELSVDYKL